MTNDATALAEVEHRTMVRLEMTAETLRHQLDEERKMRAVLNEYVKEAMKPGHHYYTFKDGDRPALTQEGAHNLCSIFKAIIGPPAIEKDYHEDGHLTVTAHVEVFNQAGERVAAGDGICSTRESKYAYRWAWDNEVGGMDVSGLKKQSGSKNGRTWTKYQIPNPDLADLYNTVLKMAVKRAKVAAVRQMPLVSELFVDDLEGDDDKPAENRSYGGARSQKSEVRNQKPEPRDDAIERVDLLVKKLGDWEVADEDLKTQFLPEGVEKWADLTAEQANVIIPQLVDLLNQKVSKK